MKTETQLLTEFMDGIGQAIGASSQLIHHRRDPRFMYLREALSKVRDLTTTLAVNPLTAPKVTLQ